MGDYVKVTLFFLSAPWASRNRGTAKQCFLDASEPLLDTLLLQLIPDKPVLLPFMHQQILARTILFKTYFPALNIKKNINKK